MQIRVAGVVAESVVDGPGIRFVVFVQGCPHHCPGCHNPETHDFNGGELFEVSGLVDRIQALPMVRGVTISGGEPFCQAEECGELAEKVKALGKDVIIYSGYTYEQIKDLAVQDYHVNTLLSLTDILIDGPYLQEQRDLNLPYRGSANQRIIKLPKSDRDKEPSPVMLS